MLHWLSQITASYWVLQNTTALHAVPVFINLVNAAILNWTHGGNASISINSQVYEITAQMRDYINNALAFTAVLFVIIAFSFIPASFAVFVVKEREINAKHQQVGDGVLSD